VSTLYEGWVLEHSQAPHHEGPLDEATHEARCDNPLCGDRVTVRVVLEDDRIAKIRFQARSCAVATASASRMTDLALGLSRTDATALATRARQGVDPKQPAPEPPLEHLAIVRDVRSRRRCATLAWEALEQALNAPETA